MKEFIKQKYLMIGYIGIFLLFAFLHLYRLDAVPYGLHIDEAGMGYDAYCLANYGVDRYLNPFPVYLINFGRGQSALYAYLCMIFVKLWGLNAWTIRLPAALTGILFYLAGTDLLKKRWGEKRALFPSFLMAVMPCFIMQSRFGLDCNLMLGLTTSGLWFLIKAVEKRKLQWYFFAGIVWGLAYYTYALSYIFNTLFLIFAGIYLLYCNKSKWTQLLFFYAPVICLGMPLLAVILINSIDHGSVVIGMITIPKLSAYAGGEFQLTGFWGRFCSFISCILGNDALDYNAFPMYATFYPISIPFALYGICLLFRKGISALGNRQFSQDTLVMLLMLTAMIFFPTVADININKCNAVFFALFYCLILGIEEGIKRFGERFLRGRTQYAAACLLLLYGIYTFSFCCYYFGRYPAEIYPQDYFAGEYGGILDYIDEKIEKTREVHVLDTSYIYYLVSSQESPYAYDMSRADCGKRYSRFCFDAAYPETVDFENCVYIVRETNLDAVRELEKYGAQSYEYGMYRLYYKN